MRHLSRRPAFRPWLESLERLRLPSVVPTVPVADACGAALPDSCDPAPSPTGLARAGEATRAVEFAEALANPLPAFEFGVPGNRSDRVEPSSSAPVPAGPSYAGYTLTRGSFDATSGRTPAPRVQAHSGPLAPILEPAFALCHPRSAPLKGPMELVMFELFWEMLFPTAHRD